MNTETAQADTSPLPMGHEPVRCTSTKLADAHDPVMETSHTVDSPKEASDNQVEANASKRRKVGRPIMYTGDAEEPGLTSAERRSLRRRIANRESARRVRDRRQELSAQMTNQVCTLEEVNTNLEEVNTKLLSENQEMQRCMMQLELENTVEALPDLEAVSGNYSLGLDESMALGLRVARDVLSAHEDDGSNANYMDMKMAYKDSTGYPRNIKGIIPQADSPYPNIPLKVKDFQPAYGEIKDPNFWQQLDVEGNKPIVQTPATPHWGKVKGFAKKESDTDDGPGWTTEETNKLLMAGEFPSYEQGNPTSGYKVIVDEVLAYSAALNDKNKAIADYWADYNHSNLPPGHWCALTVRYMYERKYTTDQAVQLLFVLTAALFDASIACWSGKYLFNKPRPITAANVYPDELACVYTFQKDGPIHIAPNKIWRPYQPKAVISPNFPAYPSGHSTFGAAFATVMQKFTNSETFRALVVVPKHSLPSDASYGIMAPATGMTLYWETFEEASQENGISRLYNGVHYQPDNVHGMEVGRRVGEKVWNVAFPHFQRAYKTPSQEASDELAVDSSGGFVGTRKIGVNGKQNGSGNPAAQTSLRQSIGTPEQASI